MRLGVNMAQQPIIEIAEFPHDNKLWRIDSLGAITSKLGNNNNLMIEVNLRSVSQSTLNQFASSYYQDWIIQNQFHVYESNMMII